MEWQLVIVLILFSTMWLISYKKEPRRLINGFLFLVSCGSFLLLLLLIGTTYNVQVFIILFVIIAIISFGLSPLIIFSFFLALWTTAIRLIQQEGRKFSNFMGILFGGVILLWLIFIPYLSTKELPTFPSYLLLLVSEGVSYFLFMFLVYITAAITYHFFRSVKTVDYIIVLGAGLLGDKVPPLLASRIDKGIFLAKKQERATGKLPVLLFSGGKGSDELISEAEAMQRYAVAQGFPKELTRIENQSRNTRENFSYSKMIIDKEQNEQDEQANILFVTNNFHVFRAALWAKRAGIPANGIGSKTKLYYSLNALIREYIGVLVMNKIFHAIVLILMFAISTMIFIINIYIEKTYGL